MQGKGILTKTKTKRTGCGNAYITISNSGQPFHMSCILGKTGGCAAAHMSVLSKVITEAINHGVPKEVIIKHLSDTTCPHSGGIILSCPDAIAKALEETHND